MEEKIMEEIASSTMARTVPVAGLRHGCRIDPGLVGDDPGPSAPRRRRCSALSLRRSPAHLPSMEE